MKRGQIHAGSQEARILEYLRTGRELEPLEAERVFGTIRLAARIKDLRDAGHDITTRIERRGLKHWAVYSLNNAGAQVALTGNSDTRDLSPPAPSAPYNGHSAELPAVGASSSSSLPRGHRTVTAE